MIVLDIFLCSILAFSNSQFTLHYIKSTKKHLWINNDLKFHNKIFLLMIFYDFLHSFIWDVFTILIGRFFSVLLISLVFRRNMIFGVRNPENLKKFFQEKFFHEKKKFFLLKKSEKHSAGMVNRSGINLKINWMKNKCNKKIVFLFLLFVIENEKIKFSTTAAMGFLRKEEMILLGEVIFCWGSLRSFWCASFSRMTGDESFWFSLIQWVDLSGSFWLWMLIQKFKAQHYVNHNEKIQIMKLQLKRVQIQFFVAFYVHFKFIFDQNQSTVSLKALKYIMEKPCSKSIPNTNLDHKIYVAPSKFSSHLWRTSEITCYFWPLFQIFAWFYQNEARFWSKILSLLCIQLWTSFMKVPKISIYSKIR